MSNYIEQAAETTTATSAKPGPKLYRAEAHGGGDLFDEPSVAVFQVDEKLARDIIKFASLVRANDVYGIERFEDHADYFQHDPETEDAQEAGEENKIRTERGCLVVTDDAFFFRAYVRHSSLSVECESQSVAELAQHFGIQFGEPLSSEKISSQLQQALPGADGYEKGYKDALESIALTLTQKIAEPILDEAINTALDAYANNTDEAQTPAPRVLVVVKGGVAESVSDKGVDVHVFDWDYNNDPDEDAGVPVRFADLAESCGVPVDHSVSLTS